MQVVLSVVISVTKEGVKFSTRGDIGTANVVCRQNTTVDKVHSLAFVKHIMQILMNLPFYASPSTLYFIFWLSTSIPRQGHSLKVDH